MTDPRTSAASSEFDLIRWIREQVGDNPAVPVGIGDDCAAVRVPPGSLLLVTTDMLIDGIHFRAAEVAPRQIGHKAMARGLSDIAAMAGDPLAAVVAMAAPKPMSVSWFQELFRGMKAVADAFNVRIVGGDMSAGKLPLTLTVTAFGAGAEGALALRSKARAGDVVLVTGDLGGSILGRHLSFLPRIKEAQWLRGQIPIHAMIDISDGLAADAGHLAEESQAGIELWEEAIPISQAARDLAAQAGDAPLDHALHDGEDYELLFAVGAREAARLLQRPDLPVRLSCIGEVVAGGGLWLRRKGEERRRLEAKGWVHTF